jgi:hypothetical protein
MSLPVLLTVRGTRIPTTLDAARVLHNDTAGSPPGIAAARALGDLSHRVFSPVSEAPGTKPDELLFLDIWCDPQGIGQFFSNHEVQGQAARLFSAKDATVWMPARGANSYQLPPPRTLATRFIGIVRGAVGGVESAIETFAAADRQAIRDARKRGIISHELFVKLPMPGDTSPPELLGLDQWASPDGMLEHYRDEAAMKALAGVFTGPPATSVWSTAAGDWSEW